MYTGFLEELGKVDAVVFNGDLIDGEGKKDTAAHLTTDITEQMDMAEEAISIVNAGKRFFVRGTGFHTDASGNLEQKIANRFGTDAHDDLRLKIHGRKLHFKHVVGRSDTPYGQHTQLQKDLINDVLQSEFEAYDAADVIVRSHVHYCVESGIGDQDRGIMRKAITTPALQLRGPVQSEFTRKLRTWAYHVGVLLIEIDKTGEVYFRPRFFPIKIYSPKERVYNCLT
jgi:hypothetical protein